LVFIDLGRDFQISLFNQDFSESSRKAVLEAGREKKADFLTAEELLF
jgi:hypothetical protein